MHTNERNTQKQAVPNAAVHGPVWKHRRWRRNIVRCKKVIKCFTVGLVAWYALITGQAAMWLTWPALVWSVCSAATIVDCWLDEEYW